MCLEILLHIHSSHVVVGIDVLQSLLQLGIAHICLVCVVGVGITMSHQQHGTLLGIAAEVGVEHLCQCIHV